VSKAVFGIAAIILIGIVIAFSIPYQAPEQDSISITPIQTPQTSCDPSYPGVCIPPYPPYLDCSEILYANFRVLQPDPHGFDGDEDGIGCESN